MREVTRRQMVASTALLFAGALPVGRAAAEVGKPEGRCTFSIGTYAMKKMKTEDAVALIAQTGYDGVEIAVRPDWDAAPARMPAERRRRVRELLVEHNLELTALMEHLLPAKKDEQHAKDIERLKTVAELGHDFAADGAPLIQTVLGNGDWEENKERICDRVGDWMAVGKDSGTVIAVKPHRGGVMSRPDEAVWLIRQLGDSPWLRMVYDYSHYAFRDMPVADTVATAMPYTAHIAVKDAARDGEKIRFTLPGESGTFDYGELFRLVRESGYAGDICCEVSAMVSGQPGYDPVSAAETCYRNLAPILAHTGLRVGA